MDRITGLAYACGALVFDDRGRVLLVKENYGRRRFGCTIVAGEPAAPARGRSRSSAGSSRLRFHDR